MSQSSAERQSSIIPADGEPVFVAEGNEIDGGYVRELQERRFNEPKHRAETARMLAVAFAVMLAGTVVIHYTCFMILALYGRDKPMESLGQIFNVWLPALTGIVSASATYYFTKER